MTERVVQFSETLQVIFLILHCSARRQGRDVVSLSSKEDKVSASELGSEHPVNSGPSMYCRSFGRGVTPDDRFCSTEALLIWYSNINAGELDYSRTPL